MTSLPTVRQHITPKVFVDNAISNNVFESSLLRLDPDENMKTDEQESIIFNSTLISPNTIIELPTRSYVDSLSEHDRNKRDMSRVLKDQDKEFNNNKLTNLDIIRFNRSPLPDGKLSNKNLF